MTIEGQGTEATRRFYDEIGWAESEAGRTGDAELFHDREVGPLRIGLDELHRQRALDAIDGLGRPVELLECGCGGAPEMSLLTRCQSYTGADFSQAGLDVAAKQLAGQSVPFSLELADASALPFEDGRFDVVYSAHMIYHLADLEAQERALEEMARVTRPGGLMILWTANPRPLLFPARFAMRVVADLPGLGAVLASRRSSPVPYRPATLGWTRDRLTQYGTSTLLAGGLPSTWFRQHVSEHEPVGRLLWRALAALDRGLPHLSAHLGNYALFIVERHGS